MTISKSLVLLIGALGSACITSMASAQPAAPQHTPAQAVTVGSLVIEQPWIRATPGGAKVAGGCLRITNRGPDPDRLVGASIPLAERGEVHEMIREGDVMKMQPVQGGIEIKPGQTVELKPGGYHLMFHGPESRREGGRCRAGLAQLRESRDRSSYIPGRWYGRASRSRRAFPVVLLNSPDQSGRRS
jgi:copper(I)-binding protein